MLSYTEPAVTVEEANDYAEARAWSNWTGADPLKEGALRRGQDYIAGIGNGRWAVEWDNDATPDEVKFSIIEAARRELAAPGSLAPDYVASDVLIRERKKVGVLEKDVQYAEPKNAGSIRPQIEIIDALLAGHLAQTSGATVALLRM